MSLCRMIGGTRSRSVSNALRVRCQRLLVMTRENASKELTGEARLCFVDIDELKNEGMRS